MDINKFVKASAADKEDYISDALATLEELWMDDMLDEAEALEAKRRAEDALANSKADFDYAKAQAELV